MLPQKRNSVPDKMEHAAASPTTKGCNLLDRMAQNLEEVKSMSRTNDMLRGRVYDAQTANEALEKANAGFKNAKAIAQARIDALQQETKDLKEKHVETDMQKKHIETLERLCKDLKRKNADLKAKGNEKEYRVCALERENKELVTRNTILYNTATAAEEDAAGLRDTNDACKQKIATLENANAGLRSMLSGERESHKSAIREAKGKLEQAEADFHQSQHAGRSDKAVLEGERIQYMACHLEQSYDLARLESSACHMAYKLQNLQSKYAAERAQSHRYQSQLDRLECKCLAADADAVRWKKEYHLEKETSRQRNTSVGVVAKEKNRLSAELKECTASLDRKRREIVSLNEYCRELELEHKNHGGRSCGSDSEKTLKEAEDRLKTAEADKAKCEEYINELAHLPTALRRCESLLEAATDAKAKCDDKIKKFTKQAGMRELAVTKLKRERDYARNKKPRRLCLSTLDLEGTPEAKLRPLIYDLYGRSRAVEVMVHGRILPRGFDRVPQLDDVEHEELGRLEEGPIRTDDVVILKDVPWRKISVHGCSKGPFPDIQAGVVEPKSHADTLSAPEQLEKTLADLSSDSSDDTQSTVSGEIKKSGTQRATDAHVQPPSLALSTKEADDGRPISHAEITLPTPISPIAPITRASTPTTNSMALAGNRAATSLSDDGAAYDGVHPQHRELLPDLAPRVTPSNEGARPRPPLEDRGNLQSAPKRPRGERSDDPCLRAPKRPRSFRQPSYDDGQTRRYPNYELFRPSY